MRIMMLSQFYAPVIGGEERVVEDLSHALVRRGHDVSVVTLAHEGKPDVEDDRGVRIHRIHSLTQSVRWLYTDTTRRHVPPWPDPALQSTLRKLIHAERPDVIHGHNWLMYSFLPLRSEVQAGVVHTLHDYSLACATKRLMHNGQPCQGPRLMKCMACAGRHYGAPKGIATTVGNWMMAGRALKEIDMFLPVSQAVADGNGLSARGLPYQVIPNFLPDDFGTRPLEDSSLLCQLPAGEFILFAGDLSRDKGIDVLLAAYREMVDAPPLVLVGRTCPDTPAVFPANVHYLNSWPHSALIEAFRRSTLVVVPSTWPEPFGMVALEAAALGRPLIASCIGGLTTIVTDGQNGLLVPPADPLKLRQALQELLADPHRRATLGVAARRHAERFGASEVISATEQVYASVNANARRARR